VQPVAPKQTRTFGLIPRSQRPARTARIDFQNREAFVDSTFALAPAEPFEMLYYIGNETSVRSMPLSPTLIQ